MLLVGVANSFRYRGRHPEIYGVPGTSGRRIVQPELVIHVLLEVSDKERARVDWQITIILSCLPIDSGIHARPRTTVLRFLDPSSVTGGELHFRRVPSEKDFRVIHALGLQSYF